MNVKKFFELAKEKGLSSAQIQIARSSSLSVSLFHHEIDNYGVAETVSVVACGVYNGKFGSARSEKSDDDGLAFLVDGIINAAKYSEKDDAQDLFKGSEKYHKKNVFNKALPAFPIERKIQTIREIDDGLFAFDERVSEVGGVAYEEYESSSEFYNSYGLKLKEKSNFFAVSAELIAKEGEDLKSAYEVELGDDFAKFNAKDFVGRLGDKTVAKLGGGPCESKKYPTVLKANVFSTLVRCLVDAASAEQIQKKSSFLCGQLNQRVASPKLTISEKPLLKNVFFTYFDDEGVARYNKDVVKKGILSTYLHNRETAKKDGVESTGNGGWEGGKIGIDYGTLVVKPSKKTFDEMIAPIKEGVYITTLAGFGTGFNSHSGDFSCQAQGFMIRDGKVAEPLTLITLSGNVLRLMKDVKAVDNENGLLYGAVMCPDVYIKSLSIGGK